MLDAESMGGRLAGEGIDALLVTGNYPSAWVTESFASAIGDRFLVLIDTLSNRLSERADVLLPAATWMEKSGTFENVDHMLQAFEQAIEPIDYCKGEAQIAMDLLASCQGRTAGWYNAEMTRQEMAREAGLKEFVTQVHRPEVSDPVDSDMEVIEL